MKMNTLEEAIQEATRIAEEHEANHRVAEAEEARDDITRMKEWLSDPETRPIQTLYDGQVARIISVYHLDKNELPV